jgi:hypothetical protein
MPSQITAAATTAKPTMTKSPTLNWVLIEAKGTSSTWSILLQNNSLQSISGQALGSSNSNFELFFSRVERSSLLYLPVAGG